MIITPINPKLLNLSHKSDEIDSLITEVNQYTLSPVAKVAAACFIFLGWVYWAYQNFQKSASLEKLKEKVLEISFHSEELPEPAKKTYTSALEILGDNLNLLELEASKFTHKVFKEIESVFVTKEQKNLLGNLGLPLYHGLARSLILENDFKQFENLPPFEREIRLSERVFGENIDRPIDQALLSRLRTKIIALEEELKRNSELTDFLAQKYNKGNTRIGDIIDAVIGDKTNTVNHTAFQFGTTYFLNIFAVLNGFSEVKEQLKYKEESLTVAFRLAMSKSQNLDEIAVEIPEIALRVDRYIDNNYQNFIRNYTRWLNEKGESRASAEEFLDMCESISPTPSSGKITPKLEDLDDYEVAEDTVVTVDSEDPVDPLEDLDDYRPNFQSGNEGYLSRGLNYLSSWVSGS